jgi:5-hydroxyisourate hydrolase-like protein (transthyretin family)
MVLPLAAIALLAVVVPSGTAVATPSVRAASSASGDLLPCDIFKNYGTPCVAAYSMDRALFDSYYGPLYRVMNAAGNQMDIWNVAAGGVVDAAEQDDFCGGTTCQVVKIYDQTSDHDDLTPGPGGGEVSTPDNTADASAMPITVGGEEAYGLDIVNNAGYRDDGPDNGGATGVATGREPEGMYMVASGTHVNSGCCFDFGNAEKNNHDDGAGTMDALNLGTHCFFAPASPCNGNGPWVQADMENGLFQGGSEAGQNISNPADPSNGSDFVTAVLNNNGTNKFQLEGGNAQSGGLTTYWDGGLPVGKDALGDSWAPTNKQGAIILGIGGDNSNFDVGSFFEGAITKGFPTAQADNAVQANIVSADYRGNTNPAGPCVQGHGGQPSTGSGIGQTSGEAGAAVVHAAGATGAGASGFSSVYTVDAANDHLQETYLPYMGDSWTSQDLTAEYCTPPVLPGTRPVAVVHCGYTSVYTVDTNGDLQETFLPAIGDPWTTQDLSVNYHVPKTDVTPTAIVHRAGATGAAASCGYTSVYTVDEQSGDLQETFLPYIGASWTTQDLSQNYHTPQVLGGTSPVAIVHCNYTSVYTVDANGDLQETFLPAIGDSWTTQDLSVNYHTPKTLVTPTAVVHDAGATGAAAACGYTSVYTVDEGGDLQETFLPYIGDSWTTQDLSQNYHVPQVRAGTSPAALVHMNYTSVYTVDASGSLQESYLPAIGDPWDTQTLSLTPATNQTPMVLLHPDASGALDWTSVYTVDASDSDLQETFLSNVGFPGDPWVTQDLSAKYGTPPVNG